MCRSGIPKTVASVFGTSTAVAATVNQTISLVNWFDDSVFIAVIPVLIIATIISSVITYIWTKQYRVLPFGRQKLKNIRNKFRK